MQETWKMTKTLANGYSSESTHREPFNEYQHDRVKMFFKNRCMFVFWTKVALASEGLTKQIQKHNKERNQRGNLKLIYKLTDYSVGILRPAKKHMQDNRLLWNAQCAKTTCF